MFYRCQLICSESDAELLRNLFIYGQFFQHTREVMSNIHLSFIRRDNLPDAAGVHYLYRRVPHPAIRTVLSEPIDQINNYNHIFYQAEYEPQLASICDANGWCPLAEYA